MKIGDKAIRFGHNNEIVTNLTIVGEGEQFGQKTFIVSDKTQFYKDHEDGKYYNVGNRAFWITKA